MENEKDMFIKQFNLEKNGFNDLNLFEDTPMGFSVKKKLNKHDKNNITLLSIYISDRVYNDGKDEKQLYIRATYGKISGNGVIIRDFKDIKLTDPIDIGFLNCFFYNTKTRKFYKQNKIIDAEKIINTTYAKHIKSTKPLKGAFIRFKLFLLQKIISRIFENISKLFYIILLIISGNRYVYEPILGDETINNKVIKSKLNNVNLEMKEVLKEGEKFKFLDYEASRWSIIFYSIIHFLLFLFFFTNDLKSELASTITKNNFLTLLYVILSLWALEVVLPWILMLLIRFFSRQSANFLYKRVKL